MHPPQAELRSEKSLQLQYQKLSTKLSHRSLFSPNSIHSSLFLTEPYHLTLYKPFILISLLQNEEEYTVEIILNDVVERLVTNVISIAIENINFEWGFKD